MAIRPYKTTERSEALHPLRPLPPRLLPVASLLLFFPSFVSAQLAPTLTVNEECVAMAFAPDARLAYAVRRVITTKRIEMQRDDIWLATLDGKKRRIVNGEKLVQSRTPFSYAIQSLRWSPDATRLTVEMLTRQMVDARGTTREGALTLLIDENGKEIKIQGAESVIPEGVHASWLGDGVTVAFLTEAVKPKLLFSVNSVRPVAGRAAALFQNHTFAAVAWDIHQGGRNAAVGVERDRSFSGPPRLVWLDLQRETQQELAELDGYLGQISLSPSGSKVAYFRDYDTLEIRELLRSESGLRVSPPTRLAVGFGGYQWAADERRILLWRGSSESTGAGSARRSGNLVWVKLPEPTPAKATSPGPAQLEPVLHELTFRDFALSPDGRWLAVTQPGNRNLLVYPVQ